MSFFDDQLKPDEKNPTSSRQPGHEEQKVKVTRRHSLSPQWDEETYRMRIDEALVGHPEINRAEKPADGFNFDWVRFEALVFHQLQRLPRGDLTDVHNVDDLVRYCIDHGHVNNEGHVLIAELLTEACKIVLHGAKDASGRDAGGFHLRDEGEGNAIDLLVSKNDWDVVHDKLDKLVKASMPYLQTTDPARISNDFSPAYSNLYSQKQGVTGPQCDQCQQGLPGREVRGRNQGDRTSRLKRRGRSIIPSSPRTRQSFSSAR